MLKIDEIKKIEKTILSCRSDFHFDCVGHWILDLLLRKKIKSNQHRLINSELYYIRKGLIRPPLHLFFDKKGEVREED